MPPRLFLQFPDDPNLAIYFGRTLGMVSSALAVLVWVFYPDTQWHWY